ncbi:DUF4410 domain-containing protein [Methylohalobius crimeensis]|uniref:DUF4410 domain-containing protein n=1 Tax=Methylohalobius crimeensis TaxID=244365 RepID=UPI0003B367CC|nr:DUF4410 domain-containing protein [Methylohalobius crimeensis]
MKPLSLVVTCLITLTIFNGCASTKVTARHPYMGPKLVRPDRIIVHDFAATPADIPPWSVAARQYAHPGTPQTAEEIAVGRQLGAQVAEELVAKIQDMGLPAVRAAGQPQPRVGDLVIMGYFGSVDEGSRVKRLVIGFGSGSAELKTSVEGYLMTNQGLRWLGSGEVDSGGGKTPGVVVPIAVTVATANPIGLIVMGGAKVAGEVSGRSTIEGTAKRTADFIAKELKVKFKEQGWID